MRLTVKDFITILKTYPMDAFLAIRVPFAPDDERVSYITDFDPTQNLLAEAKEYEYKEIKLHGNKIDIYKI